ncbi:MAG TPA: hypothetical protein DDZ66_11535 [Firmicutes bacterium]|jgi:hypothetical protein|nr:hypothetical protein [Bacillota bacterium]
MLVDRMHLQYRQNLRHWSQWVPVITLPILVLNALALTLWNLDWIRTLFIILCIADALGGLSGFYYHLCGVGQRVDGYRLQNFLVGPPIILPLMVTALSALGLLAVYWGGIV